MNNRNILQFVIIVIGLMTFLSFSKVTKLNFDKKIFIEYTGQVEGIPVTDIVTYNYEPIDNNNGIINYTMFREDFNPYSLSQNYTTKRNENGIEVDLYSIIHPMNFSGSLEAEMISEGDKFDIPKNLTVGQQLADKQGTVKLQLNENASKSLNINVTNRQVVAEEKINVNGKDYNTYKITYNISTDKYYNEERFENDSEQITEWIFPTVGILKRTSNRTVSQYQSETVVRSYTSHFSLIATKISL